MTAVRLSPSPAQRASMKAAAARGSSGNSRRMKRTLPVSIYLLSKRRIGLGMEAGAMRAGHRGIFDDRDRRVGLALDDIGQRLRRKQLLGRDRHGLALAAGESCMAETPPMARLATMIPSERKAEAADSRDMNSPVKISD